MNVICTATEHSKDFPGFLRSLEKNGKILLKCQFGKKLFFQTRSFLMHFHNILFKIDNFTFIVLTVIVPVFDLGMSFGKVKVWRKAGKRSGNLYSKLRRNPAFRFCELQLHSPPTASGCPDLSATAHVCPNKRDSWHCYRGVISIVTA